MPKQYCTVDHAKAAMADGPAAPRSVQEGPRVFQAALRGLRVEERGVTARGLHVASIHATKQYGAVEQAMGRMVAQP